MRRQAIVVACALAVVVAVGAGIAYATIPDADNVYTACMLKSTGTVRLIDTSLPASNPLGHCTSLERQIQWNQKGSPGSNGTNGAAGTDGTNGTAGTNGVSPTVVQLDPGNSHCSAGGAAITDAAGTTAYVCSGHDGTDGVDGTDGADFDGSFASQDGKSRLSVDNNGIRLETLGARLNLGILDASFDSATALTLDATTTLSVKGTLVAINGGIGCSPPARIGDEVLTTVTGGIPFLGGTFLGTIHSGSPSVCMG